MEAIAAVACKRKGSQPSEGLKAHCARGMASPWAFFRNILGLVQGNVSTGSLHRRKLGFRAHV